MASTLLAVDDSVTMRKVLEITFAGPDFRVVTANSPDAALQKLKGEKIDLVITDLSLEPINGYELCKAIKKASPSTPIIVLSSKQNAFDAAKGSAAQADDHMDKPFDTQQMIDKVKKLLAAQAGGAVAAKPAAAARDVSAQTTPSMQALTPQPAAARPAPSPSATLPAATAAVASAAPQRAKTLIYNPPPAGGGPAAAAFPARPAPTAPTPVAVAPAQAKAAPVVAPAPAPAAEVHPPAPQTPIAAAAVHVNGQMAAKLEQIGLTPAQVDAVLALSREVVERVVWEVVPVLAETLIKEELTRLTR